MGSAGSLAHAQTVPERKRTSARKYLRKERFDMALRVAIKSRKRHGAPS